MACVDLPELPLQIVMRADPSLRDKPVAVVAEDRPEAELLWLNRRAREMRLRTGMRFGVAKSLLPELVAKLTSAAEVEQMTAELVRDLQTFSPHVERDPVKTGVFYVDPSGLSHLYGGELSWGRCVQRYLAGRHFYASLVVGPSRVLAYAIARITRGVRVVAHYEQALALCREVPLERLHITPKLRDALERIGVTTLGDLVSFGADQLALRFGEEAAYYCRAIRGEEVLPLGAEAHASAVRAEVEVEPADDDVARLCFSLKRALDRLLEEVRGRGQSIRAVWMRLNLERHPPNLQRLEPSVATRDMQALLELLRLRLGTLQLPSKVDSIVLEAETADLAPGQLSMFVPRRDLAAGDRALARLRASYGDDVVCRVQLEDAHLPEAKYRFAPLERLARTASARDAGEGASMPLVRRFFAKPAPLAYARAPREGAPREGVLRDDSLRDDSLRDDSLRDDSLRDDSLRDGVLLDGKSYELRGPYRMSGGWWAEGVQRDYYYACRDGRPLLWVFYDGLHKSWFLQAKVD
jgi:nucleotidyltransferase/DNA polymerase involved in DNA repair